MSNTVELNDRAYTPQYILSQALDKSHDFDCVAIVYKTNAGHIGSITSNMSAQDMALLSKKLDLRVFNILAGVAE